MRTEQVPVPPPNETVRQETGKDDIGWIEQAGDNATGRLSEYRQLSNYNAIIVFVMPLLLLC